MFFVILGFFIIIGFFFIIYLGGFGKLFNLVDLKDIWNNLVIEVYVVDSFLLGCYYFENWSYILYECILKFFIYVLVFMEDVRYFRYDGVDFCFWGRVLIKFLVLG